ncbi:unnamed protein product [Blepharisma stoltei]|uniref:Arf-GAP domain-containing protein n=1 Tax=Blepharisma stoltei TaxID=1481888 RepID=A0AAU9JKR3_9CILI|nr:unnamed protein product [Blepharisma stoltei]
MDYQERLNRILNKPGNRACAECDNRNPRWASISLGVFVCIRCCGLHRKLGTHISKMKSVTLDKWTEEMFRIFEALDNEIANSYWEKKKPHNHSKPTETSSSHSVEVYLRDKYERKLWIEQGEQDIVERVVKGAPINPQKQIAPSPERNPQPKQNHTPKQPMQAQPKPQPSQSISQPQPQPRPQVNSVNLLDGDIRNDPKPLVQNPHWEISFPPPQPVHNPTAFMPNPPPMQMTTNPVPAFPQQMQMFPQVPNQAEIRRIEEEEKKRKISQVMSMYQNTPPVQPHNPNQFTPLGAIAAQKFISDNRNLMPQYPPHPQPQMQPGYPNAYWPSF